MSQEDDIAAVLSGYQPVDNGTNEHAQETLASVRELLEARSEVVERIEQIDSELLTSTAELGLGAIRPGDTVIFGSRDRITSDQAQELKRQITEMLPGITPVILSGLRVEAVYRPEEEEE